MAGMAGMAGEEPNRSNPANLDYLKHYIIEEAVEAYREHQISRRELLRRVLLITGSVPLAATVLAACTGAPSTAPAPAPTSPAAKPAGASPTSASPTAAAAAAATTSPATKAPPSPAPASPAARTSPSPSPSPRSAVTVSPQDPAIEARTVEFSGQGVTLKGYLSQPRGVTRAPGIVVIHENRGLTEHIKDMTRRYAKDGITALAVDLLSRQGGTDQVSDPGQIPGLLGQANQLELVQDLVSGAAYLKGLPNVARPHVGVVGYCYGGGMAWLLAVNSPDIGAAVPYYGPPPQPIDQVEKISGPVLAFYGETDQRINANIPAIEEAMQKYNKPFEKVVYPGAGHAFNNDTGPNYNAAAARDAYQRSLDFFRKNLSA